MTRDVQLLMGARVFMSAARALAGILVPIYLAQAGYSASTLGALFAAVALASAIMTTSTGIFSGAGSARSYPSFPATHAFST